MAEIVLEDVTKRYGDGTLAVEGLDLTIEDGEFMVFVGPSGCGKTTALRMIAGLETITEGKLKIGENVVNDMQPKDRDIAMVFQNYALYPHMSVHDNMAFGLKLAKIDKGEIETRVKEAAKVLGLEEYLDKKPRALSGGQRQRVALGRAIVREPEAYLMDEPLSNLDAKLRVEMRAYVQELHRRLDKTIVYVTHDQIEAMTMGDRVAVLRDGRLEQVDVPQALYDRPASLFVAAFIGSPAMNMLRGRLTAGELELGSARLPMPARRGEDRDVIVGIRPEALHPAAAGAAALEGPVVLVESLGSDLLTHVEVDAPAVLRSELNDAPPEQARVTARLEPGVGVRVGDRIRLAVDPERLHFFDPQSERALGT